VPIINGDDSEIGGVKVTEKSGGTKATVTRSTTANSIDTTQMEEARNEREDNKKDIKEEIERYHEIKKSIDSINRSLDRLSEEKERAFGGKKLALMD